MGVFVGREETTALKYRVESFYGLQNADGGANAALVVQFICDGISK